MHNLYVPPYKIFLFLISFALTYFAAKLLNDKTFPVPDFKFPETKIEVSEETDNQISKPEVSWTEIKIQTNGIDRKYGNLVGFHTIIPAEFFVKEEWWKERIEELLLAGKNANIYDKKTIVIFPEHIGSGLVLLDEKENFMGQNSLVKALSKKGESIDLKQLFYQKSERMLDVYVRTFSELAKQYKVPILGGSIILPNPKIIRGNIVLDPNGPLYNVSIPFSADGKVMDPMLKKTSLSDLEKEILEPGDSNQDRVWVVPGWKVAIFIGQEVFVENLYDRLKGRPLDGIVSPSIVYEGMVFGDKNLNDPNIWQTEGIPKYIKTTRAQDLVQVFSNGNFFEKQYDGKTFNLRDFIHFDRITSTESPVILNLYF